jgi:hypothetical protein
MQSIEYRYLHDPMVRALVDSLEQHIHNLQFTPSEIRDCAMLAAIRYEQRRPAAGQGERQKPSHNMPRVEICPHRDTWTIIGNDGQVMYKIPACIRDGGKTSPVGKPLW